jgi:hypothetical protein
LTGADTETEEKNAFGKPAMGLTGAEAEGDSVEEVSDEGDSVEGDSDEGFSVAETGVGGCADEEVAGVGAGVADGRCSAAPDSAAAAEDEGVICSACGDLAI